MLVGTKIKDLKTNSFEVDDMEITSTGNFNIPSADKYVFNEDNASTCELNGGILTVNTINELSTGGVTVESVNIDAGVVDIPDTGSLKVDTIDEKTAANGVVIDSVTCKDGGVTLTAATDLKTDQIIEVTGGLGVTIDGVLLKDNEVSTDKLNEKTASNGVEVGNYLKMTAHPLFIATMTAEPGAVTGNGAVYTCAFDTEVIDTASGYDNATYKFTAPVTGVYDFDITLHFDAVTNAAALVSIDLEVEVAGAATVITWLGLGDPLAGTGDEFIINAGKTLKLTATATVKVNVTITGEGADTCVVLAANSQFSGRLITI
jgi:hypothetical protein